MDFFGVGAFDLRTGLIKYIILVASVCVHEWAHAFAADRLGDDTPRFQGRVTLNPAVHMDMLGTVVFPLFSIFFLNGGYFGWGRPVMVNPSNFRKPTRDDILVTLAGPFSNWMVALLAAIAMAFLLKVDSGVGDLFRLIITINLFLAVFNMIPVPPLDGGQILRRVAGMSEETYFNIARWGFLVLLILINLPPFRYALGKAMEVASIPLAIVISLIA